MTTLCSYSSKTFLKTNKRKSSTAPHHHFIPKQRTSSAMSAANDKRRKYAGGGVVPESRQKKAREEEEAAVTDEEVEEFYAILRRINTAVKYFKSGGDDVASFEKEIMQEVKSGATRTSGAREEDVQENLNLDLNLTPQHHHPQ